MHTSRAHSPRVLPPRSGPVPNPDAGKRLRTPLGVSRCTTEGVVAGPLSNASAARVEVRCAPSVERLRDSRPGDLPVWPDRWLHEHFQLRRGQSDGGRVGCGSHPPGTSASDLAVGKVVAVGGTLANGIVTASTVMLVQ